MGLISREETVRSEPTDNSYNMYSLESMGMKTNKKRMGKAKISKSNSEYKAAAKAIRSERRAKAKKKAAKGKSKKKSGKRKYSGRRKTSRSESYRKSDKFWWD